MTWLIAIAVAAQIAALYLTARRRSPFENRAVALTALVLGVGLTLAGGALLADVFASDRAGAVDPKAGYAYLLAACACLVVAVAPLLALRREDARAAATARSIDHSVQGVVHDLRNMLTLVQGSASLLQMDAAASPSRELLTNIESATGRAAELLNRLDGTRAKDVAAAECDATQVLRETRELLAVAVPSAVGVVIQVGASPVLVSCDAVEFTRVVINLVVNAGEAIGSRGGLVCVSLAVREVDAAWRESAKLKDALRPGPHAVLRIADDGPGLPLHLLEKLFDGNESTKDGDRGIGLSIVRDIVNRRGGAILVSSVPQRGAVFEVALPLAGRGIDGPSQRSSRPVSGLNPPPDDGIAPSGGVRQYGFL